MIIRTLRYFVFIFFGVSSSVYAAPPPGNVNVINTPDVSVVNTPNVNVVSMPPINSVQEPAQSTQTLVFPANQLVYRQSVFTVPVDKRLVLEYVSVNYLTTDPDLNLRVMIEVSDNPGICPQNPKMRHALQVPERTYVDPTQVNYIISQTIKLYADPGDHLCVHINRNDDSTNRDFGVHLTGYYVDVP